MRVRRLGMAGLIGVALLAGSLACFAKDYSGWLKKVPQQDRERVNPYAGQAGAIAAGANLYHDNCAKCHGENAAGRPGRPSLRGADVRRATDGDLAWMLKNGQMFKGMPSWAGLPEQERWQLVAYIRSLNSGSSAISISISHDQGAAGANAVHTVH